MSSAPVFSMTQGYNEKVWMTVCVLLPTLSPSPRLSLSKSVSDDRVLCWFLSVQELMLMTLSLLKVVFCCVWSVCVLRELAGQHTCSWDWISSNVRLDSADPVAWELTNTFQWQLWSADHLQRGERRLSNEHRKCLEGRNTEGDKVKERWRRIKRFHGYITWTP